MNLKKRTNRITLIRLLESLKSERRKIINAACCSILNKLFDLAPPVLIGIAVDVVVNEKNSILAKIGYQYVPTQLFILAGLSFIIWTAESLFEYLYGVLWRNLAQTSQHKLRLKAYKHLQELDMEFFESDSSGRIMSILNDDINQLERFLDQGANQILQLVLTVFVIGSAMMIVAPKVAVLSFVPIPIILWGSIRFQRLLAPKYRNVREKAGDIASRLGNNLGGMLTIKSFATEKWELERLRKDSNSYQKSNRDAIKLSAAFIPLIRFAILFAFLSILIVGGIQAWEDDLAIGTYSFLVFITQRLLWPLTTLGQTLDSYQRSMASANRVLDLIDKPVSIEGGIQKLHHKEVKGTIKFENVTFNYSGLPPLLKNFNIEIDAGKTIGIVGPTGSGKSTLIKLLLRLYSISSGQILIDGTPIENFRLDDLRRSIALVSQEVYLFHGTIEENISYGNSTANDSEIHKAAKLAEASEFINKLPNGYKTLVGERGQRLSGGQRQRIALARAILKNAPIMILDEATAAVDNETEASIQRSLSRITKNRTTIVIAHRLSTIRNANRIIVLDKGKIHEEGTHDILINSSGIYSDLWNVQAGKSQTRRN